MDVTTSIAGMSSTDYEHLNLYDAVNPEILQAQTFSGPTLDFELSTEGQRQKYGNHFDSVQSSIATLTSITDHSPNSASNICTSTTLTESVPDEILQGGSLMQCWDWILDEHIPCTPTMTPHLTTPWRWRSPQLNNADVHKLTSPDVRDGTLRHTETNEDMSTYNPPHAYRSGLRGRSASMTSVWDSMASASRLERLATISAQLAVHSDQGEVGQQGKMKQNETSCVRQAETHQQACIFDLVHLCFSVQESANSTEVLMQQRSLLLEQSLGFKSMSSNNAHLLRWYVDLYFQKFHPLWPLFPIPHFCLENVTPQLYLTLSIIGSQYGRPLDARFGQMAHEVARTMLLSSGLDMRQSNESNEQLCLTLLLNMAIALYFGQKRSFFFAQQIKALLNLHAQRLALFQESLFESSIDPPLHSIFWPQKPERGSCYPAFARAEVRRRLAFGILRLDAYISLFLGHRPHVSWEDMQISLLGNPTWWESEAEYPDQRESGPPKTSQEHLSGTGPTNKKSYTDLVRNFLYRPAKVESSLRLIDQELLLFGLTPRGKSLAWADLPMLRVLFHSLFFEPSTIRFTTFCFLYLRFRSEDVR
jgi:hypothetical protein